MKKAIDIARTIDEANELLTGILGEVLLSQDDTDAILHVTMVLDRVNDRVSAQARKDDREALAAWQAVA